MNKLKAYASDFLNSMNNKKEGQSLRKWLAVGIFWVMALVIYKFTNHDNLVSVITVLSSLITALIVTYTVGNNWEQKINKDTNPSSNDQEQPR
jgi:hypothetical protein